MPSLGVVILNWNSYEVTKDCLECFRDFDPGTQVVVVDNGSEDESVALLKRNFEDVIVLENDQNLGFAGGNNVGISYCLNRGYDYVMLLNNDTLFTTAFASPLVQFMEENKDVGAIQPKIRYNHNRSLIWNAGGIYYRFLGYSKTIGESIRDRGQYDQLKYIDWITGCCLMVRSEVVREVGTLDKDFFIYHEDVDWSLRMRKVGHKLVYHPGSTIYHIAGVSQKSKQKTKEGFLSPMTHYLNIRNNIWVARRNLSWYHWPTAFVFLSVYLLAHMMYFVLRGRFKKFRAVVAGLNSGLTLPTDRSSGNVS